MASPCTQIDFSKILCQISVCCLRNKTKKPLIHGVPRDVTEIRTNQRAQVNAQCRQYTESWTGSAPLPGESPRPPAYLLQHDQMERLKDIPSNEENFSKSFVRNFHQSFRLAEIIMTVGGSGWYHFAFGNGGVDDGLKCYRIWQT